MIATCLGRRAGSRPAWASRASVSGARRLADLPPSARRYVDRLSELIGLPVSIISVGPDHEQTIVR